MPDVFDIRPEDVDPTLLRDQTAKAVRGAMLGASDASPEAHAESIRMATNLGVPVEMVRRNPDWALRQSRTQIDAETLAQKYPGTAKFLSDPNRAGVTRDDILTQMALEDTMRNAQLVAEPGLFGKDVRDGLIKRLESHGHSFAFVGRGDTAFPDAGVEYSQKDSAKAYVGMGGMGGQAFDDSGAQAISAGSEPAPADQIPPIVDPAGAQNVELPNQPRGFLEQGERSIRRGEVLPFVGVAADVVDVAKLTAIADRIKENKDTDQDWIDLLKYDAEIRRGTTFGGKVAAVLGQLPAFAGEFAATGGLYTAGKEVATKGSLFLAKRFLKKSAEELLENRALRMAVQGTAWAAGSMVQASVGMQHRVLAETMKAQLPQFSAMSVTEQGDVEETIKDPNDGFLKSWGKATLSMGIEVGTERVGATMSAILNKVPGVEAVKAAVSARWMKMNPGKTWNQYKALLAKGGYDGVLEEVGEEYVGDLMKAVAGLEPLDLSWEEFGVRLVSFSVLPGAGFMLSAPGMIKQSRNAAQQAQQQTEFFKELGTQTEQSKTRERMPGYLGVLGSMATENGPVQNLYHPVQTWNDYWTAQNQSPRQAAVELLGEQGGQAYDDAQAAGHDLEIPLATYVEKIAPTMHNNAISREVRMGSAEAPNVRELEAVAQQMQAQVQEGMTLNQSMVDLQAEKEALTQESAQLEQAIQVDQQAPALAPEIAQQISKISKQLKKVKPDSPKAAALNEQLQALQAQQAPAPAQVRQARLQAIAAQIPGATPEMVQQAIANLPQLQALANTPELAPIVAELQQLQAEEQGAQKNQARAQEIAQRQSEIDTQLADLETRAAEVTKSTPDMVPEVKEYADKLFSDLMATNTTSERVARMQANLMARMAFIMATRAGMTMKEFSERFQLRVDDGTVSATATLSQADVARDAEYMDAVEAGDMETAQRLVDEAAQAAGYTIGPVYHGTYEPGITVFEPGRASAMYFTDDINYASDYGDNLHRVFLRGNVGDLTDPQSDAYKLAVDTFNEAGGWSSNDDVMEGRTSPDFDPKTENTWEILDNPDTDIGGVLIEAGYTVLKLQERGAVEGEEDITSYAVFEPSQIKSADPVTRDADGNVIPLSERFNAGKDSILYQGATRPHALDLAPAEYIKGRGTVSTRQPSSVKAEESETVLRVDLDAINQTKVLKKKIAQGIRDGAKRKDGTVKYVTDEQATGTDDEVIRHFMELAKSNLRWLWDMFPKEYRDRAKLWYVGANKIADAVAEKYAISTEQAAGVFAVLSPQKDWFQNVSMGERIVEIWNRAKTENFVFTPELFNYVRDKDVATAKKDAEKRKVKEEKWAALEALYAGKAWNDLPLDGRARLFRALDETTGDRSYRIILPEGGRGDLARTADGTPSTVAWSSYNFIEKALSILEDGSIANISERLGNEHKVRNFYNNISDPNNANGYVTIDTHAVAAALLNALSGSSPEVADNFGAAGGDSLLGVSGSYGVYAEAYMELANELSRELGVEVLAREVQSVTWEAVRLLFTKEQKTSGNLGAKIDELWNSHAKGKLNIDELRTAIWDLAGGMGTPSWADTSFGFDAQQSSVAGSTHDGGPFVPLGSRAASLNTELASRGSAKQRSGVVRGTQTLDQSEVFPSVTLNQNVDYRPGQLTEAAQKLKAGEITREEYNRLAAVELPLTPFDAVPKPATMDEVKIGLGEYKAGARLKRDMAQAPEDVPAQTLESRLDIPAYREKGVWVVTLHEDRGDKSKGSAASPIAYTSTAILNNVTFKVHESAALNIASGKPKGTIATMRGDYQPMTADEAETTAKQAMQDGWVQVGMNPLRHSFFYDKTDERPVVSAEQVLQIGGLVLAKNPVYGNANEYLFQGKDAPRGQITFNPTERGTAQRLFTIGMLKKADASTFLHEGAHFWLEVFGDIATQADIPAQLAADYSAILKFLGVASREEIGTEQHEKFARAFEAYLYEGKAPAEEVRGMFASMRQWFIRIYKEITNLNVALSDDIRGVFDRMVATETEIAAAEASEKVTPMFGEKPAEMSDQNWERYRKSVEAASLLAREQLQAKLAKEIRAARTDERKSELERIREEVASELEKTREHIALALLRFGKTPRGGDLEEPQIAFKLDKQRLVDAGLDKPTMDKLRRLGVYRKEGGVDPQAASETLGFGSVEELALALTGTQSFNQAVAQEAQRRLEENHPSLMDNPAEIQAEAVAAVHNEYRDDVLAAEVAELQRMLRKDRQAVGRVADLAPAPLGSIARRVLRGEPQDAMAALMLMDPRAIAEVAKQTAERTLAGQKLRDIRPSLYLATARRKAQDAIEASTKGDYQTALLAKESELLNHALYREGKRLREEGDKQARWLQKLNGTARQAALGKAGHNYRDQINAILERFNFRPIPLSQVDRRQRLADWVAEQEAAGFTVELDDALRDEAFRKDYREMTAIELQGVYDAAKQIDHLARLKNKLLKARDDAEFEAARDEILEVLRANTTAKPIMPGSKTPLEKTLNSIGGYFAAHRKMASIVREMDGFVDNGPLYRYFMAPINDAANKEAVENEKAIIKLQELFATYSKEQMKQMTQKRVVSAGVRKFNLSHEDRLCIALNWGNEDNRKKLVDGYNALDEADVLAILDTLTEQDWKFVQSVWDYVDSFWPATKAKQERVYGIAPEKVEATPVVTKFGTFRGGYYPLKYTGAKAENESDADAAKAMLKGAQTAASTRRGHTKERVSGVERPVRLDFGVLTQHVSSVIHDLTHHEMLIDVNKILRNRSIMEAIEAHYGENLYRQLHSGIEAVAAGNVSSEDRFTKAFGYVRNGVTIAGLGFNLWTSVQQTFGLTNAIPRLGVKYVAQAAAQWIGAAKDMENSVGWIYSRSEFMRLRGKTQDRELNELYNTINPSMNAALMGSYFYLIQRGQLLADVPTWLAGYHKAMDEGHSEETAIQLADQAVIDVHGNGQVKDLAAVQRGGPLFKMWSTFYSYFNAAYNNNVELVKGTNFKSPADIGRLAVDMLVLNSLPVALQFAILSAARAGSGDDEEWWKKLAKDQISYLLGMMVFVREFGGILNSTGYEGPAGARFFAESYKLAKQVEQGEADRGFWVELNKVGGLLFHYPSTQLQRTVEGAKSLWEGKTRNPAVLILGPTKEER